MWYKRFCKDLEDVCFHELPSAPCMFRRKGSDSGGDVFLLVYVDDILTLATSENDMEYMVDV